MLVAVSKVSLSVSFSRSQFVLGANIFIHLSVVLPQSVASAHTGYGGICV